MGAIATFNYRNWVAQFSEMNGVGEDQAAGYFARATLLLRNDGTSPIQDVPMQTSLLYLLTAHIAKLNAPRNASGNPASTGQASPGIVGRISGATEGSVSVQVENQYPAGSAQWYQQTSYGSEYWAATAGYRTFRYAAKPTIVADGAYPFLPTGSL